MMYNKFQVKLMPWVAKFATSFLCAVLWQYRTEKSAKYRRV